MEAILDRKQPDLEGDQFFDLSLDMLCIASVDGYFKRINLAFTETLGYTAEELLSRPFLDFVYADDVESTRKALEILKEGQPVTDFVNRYTRRDGSIRWIHWRAVPSPDNRLIFAVARDITEVQEQEEARRKLETQVQHSQKMQAIGTLAGGIAHDFNNILSAILGYSELTLNHISQNSPAVRYVEEVLRAGRRAKDLVGQILAFSRGRKIERKPVDFQIIIDETLGLIKATFPSTISISLRSCASKSMIYADSTQIHQVILNLCTNAAQAMEENGGQLNLLLEEIHVPRAIDSFPKELIAGPYVRLMIQDSGQGMAREVLDRAFEPFFTTKNPRKGTGMGLSLVHGIITSHQGAVTIDSVPGEGTIVWVYLPLLLECSEPSVEFSIPIPTGHECILFVDDEEALCGIHQEMLENLGYEVVIHTSSIDALKAFQQVPNRFDLVITDQSMPKMRGSALTKELRNIQPTIPVIVYSGFREFSSDEAVHAMEFQARLFKPVDFSELAFTVRQVLDHHQKEKA